MANRLIKIILPRSQGASALDILSELQITDGWQEESMSEYSVISFLINSGQSEGIMDRLEKSFGNFGGIPPGPYPGGSRHPSNRTDA